jgi:hypothetical protein
MSAETVFTKPVLRTKKKSKFKILFLVLGRIIKNNPKLFLLCSSLAVMVAIINFNIGVNFKDAFIEEERTLTKKVIATLERKEKDEEIKVEEIKKILEEECSRVSEQQTKVKNSIENKLTNQENLKKAEAIKLVEEAGKDPQNRTIFAKKDFKFKFNLLGWKITERTDLRLIGDFKDPGFIPRLLLLIFVFKSLFSLIHYY